MSILPERKIVITKPGISPGSLYRQISTPTIIDEKGRELREQKVHPFVLLCKKIFKLMPSLGKGAKFNEEYSDAVRFLGWDLKPEELSATVKLTLFAGIFLIALVAMVFTTIPSISALIIGALGEMGLIYVLIVPLILVFVLINFINTYPISAAKGEEKRALTYVPEMLGYMIMSLKLVPNLEKAVEFAATHGKGKIAEEFQQLLWDVQLGVHNTLAEGLDELAYRWGNFSPEFKQSLMMLRASVLEDSEAKRYALLDKTMSNALEMIKEKMETYARGLSQPTVMLFYLGVLLPLILIIVLPIGSAFTNSPFAQPLVLSLIYNFLIPGLTAFLAFRIIKNRPPTYMPPKIDDKYPGLPKKWSMMLGKKSVDLRIVLFLILLLGGLVSFYFSTQGFPPSFLVADTDESRAFLESIGMGSSGDIIPLSPFLLLSPDKTAEEVLKEEGLCAGLDGDCTTYFTAQTGKKWIELKKQYPKENDAFISKELLIFKTRFFTTPGKDTTPMSFLFGLVLSFSLFFYVFFKFTSIYKRKKQLEVMQIESEFRDSLYIIASRLGENKPVEDAIAYARKFLPKYLISERLYGKILDNIKILGMPLEQSVFDKKYGALVFIPSAIVLGGMRILVDSVKLGVNVAARTLVSLSLQLENSEKVTKLLQTLLSDVITMMQAMITFIVPIVLGITVVLQKIVISTLASVVSSGVSNDLSSTSTLGDSELGLSNISPESAGSLFQAEAFASIATPFEFLIIIAIYVIEITIILTYFSSMIQEENDLTFKLSLARNLPIALIMFMLTVVGAGIVVGTFGGG